MKYVLMTFLLLVSTFQVWSKPAYPNLWSYPCGSYGLENVMSCTICAEEFNSDFGMDQLCDLAEDNAQHACEHFGGEPVKDQGPLATNSHTWEEGGACCIIDIRCNVLK